MAHYKRKKPRQAPSRGYSGRALARRIGEDLFNEVWMKNYPRHWDKVFHTRPARARTRLLEQRILRGEDPDDLVWPDYRKPHIYYW